MPKEKGRGKKKKNKISFDIKISIDDLDKFCSLSGRKATFEGTISFPPLGRDLPIRNGEFSLFVPDRETGKRQMTYSFAFTGRDGKDYFLSGHKILHHEPRQFDLPDDITTLYTRLYRGNSSKAPLYGAESCVFSSPPSRYAYLLSGYRGALSFREVESHKPLLFLLLREIRDTYSRGVSPYLSLEYENLVLNGFYAGRGERRNPSSFSGGFTARIFPGGMERSSGMWAWPSEREKTSGENLP